MVIVEKFALYINGVATTLVIARLICKVMKNHRRVYRCDGKKTEGFCILSVVP